ncbi:MAG: aminopeptidase P family protein [Oscillospiraceae bacterium]|nr:aminopeptidase P family protein [Oscillospiraceae bacterium]
MWENLAKNLPTGTDAALVTSVKNRLYFTLFESHSGYLLITKDKSYTLVDFRYHEMAVDQVKGSNVVLFSNIEKILEKLVLKHKIHKIIVENDDLTLRRFEKFKDLFAKFGVRVVADDSLDSTIAKMRQIKSEKEIKKIKTAQKITEESLRRALGRVTPGITTELDLSLDIEYDMKKSGASAASFDLIVLSGEKTSMPHGKPTNSKIKNDAFLTLDIGAMFEGYCSDMTRTVAIGEVGEKESKIYNIVLEAQLEGLKAIKAGILAKNVDKIVRDFIEEHGYGKYFGHSTGHGVGLDIHESPRLSSMDETVLEPGMVLTVEPGIYLPGEFGVRIEDMVLVTEDGCENLANIDKELTFFNSIKK